MSVRYGGTPICPRCSKAVYMAEQITGPGGSWHKNCLTCKECGKRLDSYSLTERSGEAYCKTCHGRKWGPKGYGFAGGASFLNTETKMPAEVLGSITAKPSEEKVDREQAEDWLFQQRKRLVDDRQETPSFASDPALDDTDQSLEQERDPAEAWLLQQQQLKLREQSYPSAYTNPSHALPPRRVSLTPAENSPVSPGFPGSRPSVYRTLAGSEPNADTTPSGPSPTNSTGSSSSQSNPRTRSLYTSSYSAPKTSYVPKKLGFQVQNDLCHQCGKVVYAAEMVLGAGNKYHKLCLKCCACGKLVDSSTMVDRGEKIYCRPCYSKEFGPKGYGYAGGAAFLTTEGSTR
ncbi:hypothetical protein BC937DRAFT_87537 [Endogone sp. FLAS-F59071]|nr:hypothetical protein BC937DRAFT_87537 [Endogone sp. FLAS-F59071]|eukprot:RUS19410.1 hypothetical protein BC937DRAFT_87537 [Endogone sp. FLAS-F59071]